MRIKSVPVAILVLGFLLPLATFLSALVVAVGNPNLLVNQHTVVQMVFYILLFGIIPFGISGFMSIAISKRGQLATFVLLILFATPLLFYYLLSTPNPAGVDGQGASILIFFYWMVVLFTPAVGFVFGRLSRLVKK